ARAARSGPARQRRHVAHDGCADRCTRRASRCARRSRARPGRSADVERDPRQPHAPYRTHARGVQENARALLRRPGAKRTLARVAISSRLNPELSSLKEARMSWDFETDPAFQRELDWIDDFVREEIEPLDFIIGHPNDFTDPNRAKLIPRLQAEVK